MVSFFGDYDLTETVHIPFNTFTSDDPSASSTITNLAAGDIEIHKDGSITQRASDAGVTVSIDFDSITGPHMAHIDLSDDTDAGFYAAGSRYAVRVEGTTVDGATINAWIGAFSVGCTLRPTTAGRKLDVTATGAAGIDWANVENPTTAVDLSATDIQLCDTVTTNTDMRGTDSAALASVVGALADAAADGDPTEADTVMQYVKQLINILIGTAGVAAFPAEAAPGNAVSLAEVIRAIHADVTGLNGDAMRGTDGANTTVPDAAGTAAALHATTDGKIDVVDGIVDNILIDTGTTLDGKIDTIDGIVDDILADTGTDGVAIADDSITAAKIATGAIDADALAADAVDEIWDEVMEGTLTARQAQRLAMAVLTGKSSGGGTATLVFRDIGDSKDRISVTVDADGNRTAVGTRDGS